jgi:hypothetical protein
MIASRPFQDAMRGMGRNALDLPVAGLAGLAIVFVAFVAPADLIERLVGATGLPSLLPAAAPPLGLTARIALAAIGALAVFGLVFVLLRLLDRTGLEKTEAPVFEPVDEEAPKLRRRDVHPDAPVRRPISAARDLGEPAPPPAPRAPAPIFVAEPEPGQEPVAAQPETIAQLMARLELGIARRSARPSSAAPAPQVFPEPGDDRLQSAIDSLQRLAARHS